MAPQKRFDAMRSGAAAILLTRVCVRTSQFVFLTYILGVAWLGVFGFSAVPVFLFYNMWSTCATMKTSNITDVDSICVDARQYGKAPNPRPGGRLVLTEVVSEVFSKGARFFTSL